MSDFMQSPPLDGVVVSVAGGTLLTGVATVIKMISPGCRGQTLKKSNLGI